MSHPLLILTKIEGVRNHELKRVGVAGFEDEAISTLRLIRAVIG